MRLEAIWKVHLSAGRQLFGLPARIPDAVKPVTRGRGARPCPSDTSIRVFDIGRICLPDRDRRTFFPAHTGPGGKFFPAAHLFPTTSLAISACYSLASGLQNTWATLAISRNWETLVGYNLSNIAGGFYGLGLTFQNGMGRGFGFCFVFDKDVKYHFMEEKSWDLKSTPT